MRELTETEIGIAAAIANAEPPAARLNGSRGVHPTIRYTKGAMHRVADEGLAALHAAGVQFYQRGTDLVRVCRVKAKDAKGKDITTPGIVTVTIPMLQRALGQSARWEKALAKVRDKTLPTAPIEPPREVAEQIAGMIGEWPFPVLAGVSGTPTMRQDGSLLLRAGYDRATGIFLVDPPKLPPIPDKPTEEDAVLALKALCDLLTDFPFVDDASQAVALSQIITAVIRPALCGPAPMHLAVAPRPGSGKSYLADIAAMIALGTCCPVLAAGKDPKEFEKRLNGAALQGSAIQAIDNLNGTIESDLLCQMLSQELLDLRPLGTSDLRRVGNTFTVFANGNNARVASDLVRRTLRCALDANLESPETRTFSIDPLATIKTDRAKYVAAVLTIVRAYLASKPELKLAPFLGYDGYSRFVRSPLIWLGQSDPVATVAASRDEDPEKQAIAAILATWPDELRPGCTTARLIYAANERHPITTGEVPSELAGQPIRIEFYEATRSVASDRHGGVDATRLGQWLARNKDVVCNGWKLQRLGSSTRPEWSLIRI